MTRMSKGSNIALSATSLRVVLHWISGPEVPDVDVSALLLEQGGEVGSDADFVFYNQPTHFTGSVQHGAKTPGADSLDVDLTLVPDSVDRIVVAASADGGTFGQVPGLVLEVADSSGGPVATFAMDAATETAFVCGELYRRAGAWKFRAVGQGYASGLAGLADDFGIDVGDDTSEPAAAPPAPPAIPAAPPAAPAIPAAPPPAASPAEAAAEPIAAPVAEPFAAVAPSLDLTPPAPPTAAPSLNLTPPAPPTPAPSLDLTPPVTAPPAPIAPPAPPTPAPSLDLTPPAPPTPAPSLDLTPPAAPIAPPPPPVTAPPAPPGTAGVTLDAGPVQLAKRARVPLARGGRPVDRVALSLTWQPADGRRAIDLDASAIAFDAAGKRLAIVWHMNKDAFYGALHHPGDNQTGAGDGEYVLADLSRMPDQVAAVVFTVNSYRDQTFSDIVPPLTRVLDANTGQELVRYQLDDVQHSTAALLLILRRTGPGFWEVRTIGEYHDCRTVKKLVPAAARHVALP